MSWARSHWIVLALAACSGGGGKDAPAPGSGSTGSATVSEAPLPGASGHTSITQVGEPPKIIAMDEPHVDLPKQESFTLLDPGTGPRAVLRYAAPSQPQPWTVTTTSELSTRHLNGAAWTDSVRIPKFSVDVVVTPAPAQPHHFTLRMVAPTLSAPDAEADQRVAKWRKLLEGRLATVDIDDRGNIAHLGFNDDPTLARSAEARDALFSVLRGGVLPLPEQPVGRNARWRVVTLLRLGPLYAKVTTTYTLVGRSGSRWQIRATSQEIAPQQRINDPDLPADLTAELIALFRSTDFTGEVDQARPFGSVASATVEYRIHMRLSRAGAPPVDQMFEDLGTVMMTTVADH